MGLSKIVLFVFLSLTPSFATPLSVPLNAELHMGKSKPTNVETSKSKDFGYGKTAAISIFLPANILSGITLLVVAPNYNEGENFKSLTLGSAAIFIISTVGCVITLKF